jgi:multiple antibiotic resistance protein
MVFPKPPDNLSATKAQGDIAFTPIAMPALSGPGSISVVLTISSQIPDDNILIGNVIILIGIALTSLFAWLVLRASAVFVRFLGPSGIDALTRIFGFLLVCMGVQNLLTGTADFFMPLLKSLH